MKLTITPGAGRLTLFTLTCDTETLTLVSDPANECRPAVERGEWERQTGGGRPLPAVPGEDATDGERVRR